MPKKKRKPGPGKCVHCLKYTPARNWDHVFPQSWYPDCTPDDLEKWKIPSCVSCNNSYSVIEGDLLVRFGMLFGPEDLAASGIGAKALRALDPRYAKDERDARARKKKRKRILDEIKVLVEPPGAGILPGMGPRPYFKYSSYPVLPIPREPLTRMAEKFVRGLHYVVRNQFIEPPLEIQITFCKEEDVEDVSALILRSGQVTHRGPGFGAAFAFAEGLQGAGLWKIQAWGKWIIYGAVSPPDALLREKLRVGA